MTRKALTVLASVIQLGLQAVALIDLSARDAREVRGPKWAWALASFVNFFGPLAYLLFGGVEQRGTRRRRIQKGGKR
ncbi:PLD nuclease N-terminal domain-containing protein [Nesterenkonia aerolata]|uniref:PLD nuclease N-terminal domain-containing protein n=1 Tax=Nesterenkonia aerolata TaxID=3074079 RepID=A0ABU2DQD6_9MICC|nr:PLD nuclease N-terminal domain-containing protein [Nesterenkonia sp. LY-0111]MDR8018717.1 PLD nuclease N-terminal domain-containing protein [Nesterenkonia sp. LY-0111]